MVRSLYFYELSPKLIYPTLIFWRSYAERVQPKV
jgi:hypothetical protein